MEERRSGETFREKESKQSSLSPFGRIQAQKWLGKPKIFLCSQPSHPQKEGATDASQLKDS